MKDKVITAYELPKAQSGDIYVRVPSIQDKDPMTMRKDRETGEYITLWEEKIRYPYKTKTAFIIITRTEKHCYEFPLKMDEDGSYFYNGSNIPRIAWTLLGLNPGSPEGMIASLAHDNLLQHKQYSYDRAKIFNKDITVPEFRKLTTSIYTTLLRNSGVDSFRANLMGFFINSYQFFNPDWKEIN